MENDRLMSPRILGITGAFGSGKTTASTYFAEKGFTRIVLSSFLEDEAKKRGVGAITRKILQDIGNEWREKYGAEVLAAKALERIKTDRIQKAVIDGIRNIKEIELLRSEKGFTLLSIVANRQLRYHRLKDLQRREQMTWEVFNRLDFRDLGIGEKETGLQVALCIALADIFIDNNSTQEDFKKKLTTFYQTV